MKQILKTYGVGLLFIMSLPVWGQVPAAKIEQLEKIYDTDQGARKQHRIFREKYGYGSVEMDSFIRAVEAQDAKNRVHVIEFLEEYGWCSEEMIGHKANMAVFLAIQHGDLNTQRRYLPLLRRAYRKGEASASQWALLRDRVAMRRKKKQYYGTQVLRNKETKAFYVYPIRRPKHVDNRRAALGLPPLAGYLKLWEIEWPPAE